jgi:hypothetical protein|tara:strand:+ start:51 stop:158 length:108 start_codon:yes stop_codon:yes gene_type:complete
MLFLKGLQKYINFTDLKNHKQKEKASENACFNLCG